MTGTGSSPRARLRQEVDQIEEAYEYFLAYAAQGLDSDGGGAASGEIRQFLSRMEAALRAVSGTLAEVIADEGLEPRELLEEFRGVIGADARAAAVAVALASARPAISSLLIDNLNASMHLRAILTDLFFLDELIDLKVTAAPTA
jgi:hypothetical protein